MSEYRVEYRTRAEGEAPWAVVVSAGLAGGVVAYCWVEADANMIAVALNTEATIASLRAELEALKAWRRDRTYEYEYPGPDGIYTKRFHAGARCVVALGADCPECVWLAANPPEVTP